MKRDIEQLAVMESRQNGRFRISQEDRDGLAAWRRDLSEVYPLPDTPASGSSEQRAQLGREFREVIKELAPEFHSRATVLGESFSKHRERGSADRRKFWDHVIPHLDTRTFAGAGDIPPPPDGWFWWGHTDAGWTASGLSGQFESDGLHFFGNIDYDGDPLVNHHIGATATFELGVSRRPPSANGRWRSTPHIELFGQITGFTGFYDSLWAADDKWCKVKLYLRQTALQILGSTPVVIGSNSQLITLIDEENKSRTIHSDLLGFRPMPIVEFGLVDPNRPVIVDLEVRFDMQVEGNSFIGFSPNPNPFQSVLLRHFQWQVQAI